MDDDVIPKPDALEQLLKCPKASDGRTGFLCSVIRWTDGGINLMTAPNVHPDYPSLMELFPQGLLRLSSASFVSILFHRRAVAAKGLPLREMFLWFDDEEYTSRITDDFSGYQVLASEVEHRTKTNYWVDFHNMAGLSPDYLKYGLRNFIFLRERDAPPGCARLWRLKSAVRLQGLVWRQFSGAAWGSWRGPSAAVWFSIPKSKCRNERGLNSHGITEENFSLQKPNWNPRRQPGDFGRPRPGKGRHRSKIRQVGGELPEIIFEAVGGDKFARLLPQQKDFPGAARFEPMKNRRQGIRVIMPVEQRRRKLPHIIVPAAARGRINRQHAGAHGFEQADGSALVIAGENDGVPV